MPTIAIIGAGPLGRWLARSAARAGYRVLLEDVMPLNLHHAREALRLELNAETLPSVTFVSSIEDAVREADLAIDCVPDELESKLEIFCLLDRMSPPRTVIATPTTHMSIGDLAGCTYRADRCVAVVADSSSITAGGAHAAGPLLLRTTEKTSPEVIAQVTDFWRRVGFEPHVETEAQPENA